MRKLLFKHLAVLLLAFFFISSIRSQDTLRTYIFGHSLINHALPIFPIPSQETSVPHWFKLFANQAGYGYEVSGQYGFLPGHATGLPPNSQWGFDSVPGAWDDYIEPFSDANFDNILITPGNFIQYQPPTLNYYGDTLTPISATNMIFEWADSAEDSLNFYIYENWPDMAGFLSSGFPPSDSEWTNYNNYLKGGFHDWFLEYHDSIVNAHPGICVKMIPTGPIISDLLLTPPYDNIPIDTLYEDDAPHGRATIYFLAGLVTYMAMYEEPAPLGYSVPSLIDTTIANNYPDVVNFIWNELINFNDSLGISKVFCQTPLTAIAENPVPDEGIRLFPNPSTGLVYFDRDIHEFRVEVIDLNGKIVPVNYIFSNGISLNGLSNGIYFIRLTDPLKEITSFHKIMLNQ